MVTFRTCLLLKLLDAASADQRTRPISFMSTHGTLTANGVPFQLKGAIWRGAEGPGDLPEGLEGDHAHSVSHYMELLAAGTFNTVRLDFNHKAVLDGAPVQHFDSSAEPGLAGKNYVQALRFIAQEAARHGLLVMLSCTRLSPRETPGNGLWHSHAVPEEAVLRSWSMITNALCGQPNIFAVNIFDSPHGAAWGLGSQGVDWRAAAQRIGNHVLSGCPRLLIMVQGARSVSWSGASAPEFPPGFNLMGAREQPLVLQDPSKLVYAPVLPPPSEHMLPAYRASGFPANMPVLWARQFGFVPETTGNALVVARAGGLVEDVLDKTWQEQFVAWAVEHKVGLFYDCLNANPSNGGMLHKDWSTLRAMKVLMLNDVPATKVSSLPPPGPSPVGILQPSDDGLLLPPPPPALTELVCIKSVFATGLRGALDWQAGGTMSTALLSIFEGPGWGRLLYEGALSPSSHSVHSTVAGDRLQIVLNESLCFPTPPVLGANEDAAVCFQLADVTLYSRRVRYVNRGCGGLQRSGSQELTVTLNDDAQLTALATVTPIGGAAQVGKVVGQVTSMVLLPIVGLLAAVVVIKLLCRMRVDLPVSVPCPSCSCRCGNVTSALLRSAAWLLNMAGFAALATEVTRRADNRHAPLPRQEPVSSLRARGAVRGPKKNPADEQIRPPFEHKVKDELTTIGIGVGLGESVAMADNLPEHTSLKLGEPSRILHTELPMAAIDAPPDMATALADISALLSQSDVLSHAHDSGAPAFTSSRSAPPRGMMD